MARVLSLRGDVVFRFLCGLSETPQCSKTCGEGYPKPRSGVPPSKTRWCRGRVSIGMEALYCAVYVLASATAATGGDRCPKTLEGVLCPDTVSDRRKGESKKNAARLFCGAELCVVSLSEGC